MPAPNIAVPRGAVSPRQRTAATERTKPKGHTDTKASTPGSDGKGNKKKKGNNTALSISALNPPFDPRMRRIGSPLNLTNRIKRGWILDEAAERRVNFLFNPPDLAVSAATNAEVPTPDMLRPDQGGTVPSLPSTGSSTGVKLLYDRTYEMFSRAGGGSKANFANRFGVWADVAAWYYFLDMLPAYPDSWDDSMITSPPIYKLSYLFLGPKLVFYGYVSSINVTYSHWTQEMVPVRCAVDVGFEIIPHTGDTPGRGEKTTDQAGDQAAENLMGWAQEWASLGGGN